MNITIPQQLDTLIKQRQLDLWAKIVRVYEIDPSQNSQVRKWIVQGTLTDKAALIKHHSK